MNHGPTVNEAETGIHATHDGITGSIARSEQHFTIGPGRTRAKAVSCNQLHRFLGRRTARHAAASVMRRAIALGLAGQSELPAVRESARG